MIEAVLAITTLMLVCCWRAACGSSVAEYAMAKSHHQQACMAGKGTVPEDAVLRRHFITQVCSEIEAGLSPRPTDSVLLRHHEALLTTKLEQRLAELGPLRAC